MNQNAAPRSWWTGALRLLQARTTEPSEEVERYARQVTTSCPYLAASLRRAMTGWTAYATASDGESIEDVEADLFAATVLAAEWVRPLITRPRGALVCENIVLTGSVPNVEDRELLAWPHWVAKNLYASAGIMVGKFWRGEDDVDRNGHRIAMPPVSFLSVRPAVKPRDPRFLEDTPELAATLSSSHDDGRDVLATLPANWKDLKEWARSLL